MTNQDFTTIILVDKSPKEVFDAVVNVRGWWSENIEGNTEALNEEFLYQYKDVHRCKIKLGEVVPEKKIVWLVLDNQFSFTKDKTEWKDTKVSFDISIKGDKTQLIFTHIGLVAAYECFDICSDAWGNYIRSSLKNLIETGKGHPNPYIPPQAQGLIGQDFTTHFLTDQSLQEAFKAINQVNRWWIDQIEGSYQALHDEFEVRFADVHYSKQRIIELIPDQKVVWLVTDSLLSFVKDTNEWTNTHIVFELSSQGKQTKVQFTHEGLAPHLECYSACSNAWSDYIQNSLRNLIATGKGQPTMKK